MQAYLIGLTYIGYCIPPVLLARHQKQLAIVCNSTFIPLFWLFYSQPPSDDVSCTKLEVNSSITEHVKAIQPDIRTTGIPFSDRR